MLYQLDQNNYCDFRILSRNRLPERSYFIPYPDEKSARRPRPEERRYKSPKVVCLNGDWDFKFYPRPAELGVSLETDEVSWDKIPVPACWQFQGYDKPFYVNVRYQFPCDPPKIPELDKVSPVFSIMTQTGKPGRMDPGEEYNFVGVYRHKFKVKQLTDRMILSFLGVASCLDLYVNGRFVGYSEGSHNTAEFDVTELLKKGENELVAVVHRWCNGSYLECQDMFRNNGIFRDVLLRMEDATDPWDVTVRTERIESADEEGLARYSLEARVEFKGAGSAKAAFLGEEGRIEVENAGLDNVTLNFPELRVREWTAETPQLYDLVLTAGKSTILLRVGFKDIRIEGRRFLLNGKTFKIKGVNHHDTSSTNGYTMTPAEIRRDVELCKRYNINAIRTSHYPPDPLLLDLCDELGIYVVDEADIETHGCVVQLIPPNFDKISHDPDWQEHYVDRARHLYHRDKNHSSVIMWSLGNEAGGYRNQDAMAEWIRSRSTLPIHYESVIHTKRRAYDVGSEMYPSVEHVREVAQGHSKFKELNDRPYFLCEYVHAMGVGPGAMEDYWKEFYAYDALMGGCIWEMVDHAVLHPDGSYTYGGDHGEWEHDRNFCVDGIFYPDRTPSTGARIAKFVYRPLRVSCEGEGRFTVFNTKSYTGTDMYRLEFVDEKGRRATLIPDVPPMGRTTYTVEFKEDPAFARKEARRPLAERDRQPRVTVTTVDIATGDVLAEETILTGTLAPLAAKLTKPLGADLPEGFALCEGKLNYSAKGEILMAAAAPFTTLSRAATDNDVNLLHQDRMKPFYELKEEVIADTERDGYRKVIRRVKAGSKVFIATERYERTEGGLLVTASLHCEKGKGELPRYGLTYRLPASFDKVSFLGRASESYCDMKDQAVIARVDAKLTEMTEPNIRPQESGNRMDTQFVKVSDGRLSLRFAAVDAPFELSVKPYSDEELRGMAHREDEKVSGCYVTIQAFQMGIGTGSCGPVTRPEYCYDMRRDYTFRFLISAE